MTHTPASVISGRTVFLKEKREEPAMKKSKLWICICALVAVLLILLSLLFLKQRETVPEETTTPTTTTAATETFTQPVTDPTETTVEAEELYWVFAYGGLWVRSGPSTEYALVGSLEDGDVIEVLEWKDGWAYLKEPVKGWCSGDYIHKLGWYKDVKTPEGSPLQDNTLKGKWVHATTPVEENGVWTCRAGIYRLRSNGTFIHSVADYRKNEQGKWELADPLSDQPYWVGEYDFDTKQLTLRYMAELVEEYDKTTGEPKSREWVEWVYDLTMDVTKISKGLTISNGTDIPLTVANEHAGATENTLYKASNAVGTPEDVCAILDQYY